MTLVLELENNEHNNNLGRKYRVSHMDMVDFVALLCGCAKHIFEHLNVKIVHSIH